LHKAFGVPRVIVALRLGMADRAVASRIVGRIAQALAGASPLDVVDELLAG